MQQHDPLMQRITDAGPCFNPSPGNPTTSGREFSFRPLSSRNNALLPRLVPSSWTNTPFIQIPDASLEFLGLVDEPGADPCTGSTRILRPPGFHRLPAPCGAPPRQRLQRGGRSPNSGRSRPRGRGCRLGGLPGVAPGRWSQTGWLITPGSATSSLLGSPTRHSMPSDR